MLIKGVKVVYSGENRTTNVDNFLFLWDFILLLSSYHGLSEGFYPDKLGLLLTLETKLIEPGYCRSRVFLYIITETAARAAGHSAKGGLPVQRQSVRRNASSRCRYKSDTGRVFRADL